MFLLAPTRKFIAQAEELAQKALGLDDSFGPAYRLLGYVYRMKKQHEKAIAEVEKAIALNPNSADAHAHLGMALVSLGRPEEAIASLKKAIRLNPIPPGYYLFNLGQAYLMTERYEEAIAAYRKSLHRSPDSLFTHTALAATYALLGREEEAHAEAAEILRINPKFSVEHFAKTLPSRNQADTDRFVDALRKAGLK